MSALWARLPVHMHVHKTHLRQRCSITPDSEVEPRRCEASAGWVGWSPSGHSASCAAWEAGGGTPAPDGAPRSPGSLPSPGYVGSELCVEALSYLRHSPFK